LDLQESMSMGKGSGRRPPAISDAELKSNWDRTFPVRERPWMDPQPPSPPAADAAD